MEIPHSSFLRVGSQLAREAEMDPIINIFLDNGYTLQFTRDILEPLAPEQINYFLENLPKLRRKLETSKEDIIHFLTSTKVSKEKSKSSPITRFPEGPIDTAFMSSKPKFIPYTKQEKIDMITKVSKEKSKSSPITRFPGGPIDTAFMSSERKFIPNTRKQEKIDMINRFVEENKTLKCLQNQHKGKVIEPFQDLSFLRELTPVEIEKAHIALFDFLQEVISNKNLLPDILHKVEQCVHDATQHPFWLVPLGECSVSYLTLPGVDEPTKRLIKNRILTVPFLSWVNKSKTPNEKVQKIAHRISCFGEYFGELLNETKIKRGGKETRKIN